MQTSVGQMRDRILIQQEVRNPDNAGGGTVTWKDVQSVWANVAPLSASVRIQSMAQALMITHKVTIRYLDYLATEAGTRYRFVWRGLELRITAMPTNPDQVRRFLEITCMQGQMVGQ